LAYFEGQKFRIIWFLWAEMKVERVIGIEPNEHRILRFQGFPRQIIGFTRQTMGCSRRFMGWFRQSIGWFRQSMGCLWRFMGRFRQSMGIIRPNHGVFTAIYGYVFD